MPRSCEMSATSLPHQAWVEPQRGIQRRPSLNPAPSPSREVRPSVGLLRRAELRFVRCGSSHRGVFSSLEVRHRTAPQHAPVPGRSPDGAYGMRRLEHCRWSAAIPVGVRLPGRCSRTRRHRDCPAAGACRPRSAVASASGQQGTAKSAGMRGRPPGRWARISGAPTTDSATVPRSSPDGSHGPAGSPSAGRAGVRRRGTSSMRRGSRDQNLVRRSCAYGLGTGGSGPRRCVEQARTPPPSSTTMGFYLSATEADVCAPARVRRCEGVARLVIWAQSHQRLHEALRQIRLQNLLDLCAEFS